MRHAGQHLGNAPVVGKLRQFRNVIHMRRSQQQPLGDENGAIYRQTLVFQCFLLGNHDVLQA